MNNKMLPQKGAFIMAAITLLVATHVVVAQRTSAQFSFPPSSFGTNAADLFSANGLSPQQPAVTNSAGAQSTFFQINGPLQPVEQGQPQSQLLASTLPQQQAPLLQFQQPSLQQPQQPRQPEQQSQQQPPLRPSIQLARPTLSLTSFTTQQQPQTQQPQPQEQPQQPQASSVRSSQAPLPQAQPLANAAAGSGHSSSRHHAQQANSSGRNIQAVTPAAAASNHGRQSQHPANVQPQQTSQAVQSAQSQQAAIDAARKAEATAASLAAGASSQSYQCPDSFGYFRHHKSCDKYYACENGTATVKLCGNGLMFDDSDPKRENCAYPFSVDCGKDRTDLEPPISTPHCPRLYGLFHDNSNCRVFYSCWNGEASKYECPPGLAYDNEQRVCVWADLVERCDQSEVSDGFVCPDPTEVDQPGHYTRHAHPTDCRKFYVCIEGVARPYGCSFGTVFNVDSLQCDEPENVSGCEKYYGDLDPKLAKKLARENAQQSGKPTSSSSRTSSSSASSSTSSS